MNKAEALAALRTFAELAQKEFNLSDSELQAVLFAQSVPATIFTADSTPLEAVISYLAAEGADAKAIGKQVGRTTNYVKQVLRRGRRHKDPVPTQYHIPLALLRDGPAGAMITKHLASYGLSDKQIAELLRKDESTVWTWRKRGESR